MKDSMDWTPQQALQNAIDFCNDPKGYPQPDGVLILFHYNDGPIGEEKPKRSFIQSGMRASDMMALCNYVNQLAFNGISTTFKNIEDDTIE